MGAGGVPNRGVEITEANSLEKTGHPNSKVLRYKNGKLKQARWYDNEGRAIRNRDYAHSGTMDFPHDHDWDCSSGEAIRGEEHLQPDYKNYN